METPNKNITNHEVLKRLEVHNGTNLKFDKECVKEIDNKEKIELLQTYFPVLKEYEEIKTTKVYSEDKPFFGQHALVTRMKVIL